MKISRKREAGSMLRRAGISAEIIKLCKEVAENQNYKKAIETAGRISVLAQSATYDSYWSQKANIGIARQEIEFDYMLKTAEAGGSKKVSM